MAWVSTGSGWRVMNMSAWEVRFTVPGKPEPKGRHRTMVTKSGKMHTYTPDKTVNYEALVKKEAWQAMAGRSPLDAPITLVLRIQLPCPDSWSDKRKREAYCGDILPTKKPDGDNIVKAIKDGCNKILWVDDAQVVDCFYTKRYSATPRVEIAVMMMDKRSAP